MSIKICVLATGETVIGDVKEVIDREKNESLGYRVDAPYVIEYKFNEQLNLENLNEEERNDSEIAYHFWAPLSKDRDFNFTFDFVKVIYEPHDMIIQSYLKILEDWQKQNTRQIEVDPTQVISTVHNGGVEEIIENNVLNGVNEDTINVEVIDNVN